MSLFSGDIQNLVESATDATWYKQQVISDNIANVSTPGFKAKTVDFRLVLDNQMSAETGYKTGSQGATKKARLGVYTYEEPNTRQELDGNNVDIDKERVSLADVQYQYSALIDFMNANYSNIRAALNKN
jgi:flagellar basal-body rod protein FlgB